MNTEEFRESLEALGSAGLIHYIQQYICLSIGETKNPAAQSHTLLDLVYAECVRRGKERLYDKIYESVSRDPQICRIPSAA